MLSIHIFVSSPGDVKDERAVVRRVVERLQAKYWSFVRLEDVFWETSVVRSTAHYQDELISPGDCQIVIGVFWSRLGSPLPEKFKKASGERYLSGTEWELEAAFEAYEKQLHAGRDAKVAEPDIVIYRRRQTREPLKDAGKEAEAREQDTLLEDYIRRNYFFPDGTIKRPIAKYPDPAAFELILYGHLEELIVKRLPRLSKGFEPPPISGSPFKGLNAFNFEDSDRFFGRNREIREIQKKFVEAASKQFPFLVIYGGSGYGKSSLMRAGLVPLLTRPGASLPSISRWRRLLIQPSKGDGPLHGRLSSALLQAVPEWETERQRFDPAWPLTGLDDLILSPADRERLRTPAGDGTAREEQAAIIEHALSAADCHLLLQVDQLEEIFHVRGFDDFQRQSFLALLRDLCLTGRVWIVATMRSEYFTRAAEEPALAALVGTTRSYTLSPPDRQSLREMIRYPVMASRLEFQSRIAPMTIAGEEAAFEDLGEQILEDAASSRDALPLLEFTLQQLYDQRQDRFLQWQDYQQAGGLKGSIAKRAFEVFQHLQPGPRAARDRIFASLVDPNPHLDGGPFTRSRASLEQLRADPDSAAFIDSFVQSHLLVTDEDSLSGKPTVSLAHDALVTHWDELSTWAADHRSDLLARRRLADQTGLWLQNGRAKSYLLEAARLAEAERVAANPTFHLQEDEKSYLAISRQQSLRKIRLLRSAAVVFAVVAAIASVAGIVAFANMKEANRQKSAAVASGEAEKLAKQDAEHRRVEAELAKKDADQRRGEAELARAKEAETSKKRQELLAEAARSDLTSARGLDVPGSQREALAYLARASGYDPQANEAPAMAMTVLQNLPPSPIPRWVSPARHRLMTIDFSRSGLIFVTASTQKKVEVWSSLDGRLLHSMETAGEALHLRLSPNEKQLAIVFRYGNAWLYQLGQAEPLRRLTTEEEKAYCVDFSPDGKFLALGMKGAVLIQDLATGKVLQTLREHDSIITDLKFSPDSTHLFAADSTVHKGVLWQLPSFTKVAAIVGEDYNVGTACFSSDGKMLLTTSHRDLNEKDDGGDFSTRVMKSLTDADLTIENNKGVLIVPEELRERLLNDPSARVWDVASGKLLHHLKEGHKAALSGAVFSQDGLRIATASLDGKIGIWVTATGRKSTEFEQRSPLEAIAFSPDGLSLIAGDNNGICCVWNCLTGDIRSNMTGFGSPITDVAFSPGGSRMLTLPEDGYAALWDTGASSLRRMTMVAEKDLYLSLPSANGKRVLTLAMDHKVRVWDSETFLYLFEHDGGSHGNIRFADISQDGLLLAAGTDQGHILIWNIDRNELVLEKKLFPDSVSNVKFSPKADYLIASSDGGKGFSLSVPQGKTVALDKLGWRLLDLPFADDSQVGGLHLFGNCDTWDYRTGEHLRQFHPILTEYRMGNVKSARLHTASGRFASCSTSPGFPRNPPMFYDRTARLWDWNTRKQLQTFTGHQDEVMGVSFNSDGSRVITCSLDKTVRVWNCDTGTAELVFSPHRKDGICTAEFIANDTAMITASYNGELARSEMLGTREPTPDWFPDLLRTIARVEMSPGGGLGPISSERWRECLARATAGATEKSRYADIAAWFLDPPMFRRIRPGAKETGFEMADRMFQPGFSPPNFEFAYDLCPVHPLAALAQSASAKDPAISKSLQDYSMTLIERLPDDQKTEMRRRAGLLITWLANFKE